MTRSELIKQINDHFPHLRIDAGMRAVEIFFVTIADTLADNNRVELRGFGVFTARERQARQGRNPKTGQKIAVEQKKIPFFKAGKELKQRLNVS